MTITTETYIANAKAEHRDALYQLHSIFLNHLPYGFEAITDEKMMHFVVPLSRYKKGYHTKKHTPLPFISIASMKHHIAIYHLGLYASVETLKWFIYQHQGVYQKKLDIGKSCIRYQHMDDIPFDLYKELARKITVDQWIQIYESTRGKYLVKKGRENLHLGPNDKQ